MQWACFPLFKSRSYCRNAAPKASRSLGKSRRDPRRFSALSTEGVATLGVIPPLDNLRPETAGETAARDGRRLGAGNERRERVGVELGGEK